MKRRNKILAAIAVAIALFGGYTAYWLTVAAQLQTGLDNWLTAQGQAGLTIKSEYTAISGFPFTFHTTFRAPRVSGVIDGKTVTWRGADVEALVSPLDLHAIRLISPGRHAIDLLFGSTTLDAAGLEADLEIGRNGQLSSVALRWRDAKLTLLDQRSLASGAGTFRLTVPPAAPKTEKDPLLRFTLKSTDLSLPEGARLLTTDPLKDIEATGTIKGAMPAAPLRAALSAWSDAGGTVDLSRFAVSQATLTLDGSATVALDGNLQPIVAADLKARGLAPTIDLLVKLHRLQPEDALKMKLFVKGAERDAPDGGKEVATGLTLQDGYLSWGPFKLAKIPPILWP